MAVAQGSAGLWSLRGKPLRLTSRRLGSRPLRPFRESHVVKGLTSGSVLLLVVASGCLAAPAVSAAQGLTSIPAGRSQPVAGPRLVGNRVIWAEPRARGAFAIRERSLAGGSSQQVFVGGRPRFPRSQFVDVRLAVSPSQFLVQQGVAARESAPPGFTPNSSPGTVIRVSGAGSETLARGPDCASTCFSRQMDVDQDMGIFQGPRPNTVSIRDFAAADSQPLVVDGFSTFPRVRGRYAAWAFARDIVVYDHVARTEAYRLRGVLPDVSDLRSLDLQGDGKVAFEYRPPGRQSVVAWASPAQPFEHRLPLRDTFYFDIRLDQDRILFVRGSPRGELGVTDLAGREKVLARGVEGEAGRELLDIEGDRVAWLESSCRGLRIRVASLAELRSEPRNYRPRACRLRLERPIRRSRDGFVAIRLSCLGTLALRCETGRVVLATARRYRLRNRTLGKGTRLAQFDRSFRRGPRTVLRLTKAGRVLARRRAQVRVTVSALVRDSGPSARRRTPALLR